MIAYLQTNKRNASLLLSGVIGVRMLIALILLYTIPNHLTILSFAIFALAVATDALDGYLGRRLRVSVIFGPYADPLADFVLVLACFSAFAIMDIYPVWVLLLIIGMFAQFVVTSRWQQPFYDPVGKYYGVFLFGVVGMTLISWGGWVTAVALTGLIGFTLASLTSRAVHLYRRHTLCHVEDALI